METKLQLRWVLPPDYLQTVPDLHYNHAAKGGGSSCGHTMLQIEAQPMWFRWDVSTPAEAHAANDAEVQARVTPSAWVSRSTTYSSPRNYHNAK